MTTKIINNFNSLNSEDLSIIEGEGVIGCVAGAAGISCAQIFDWNISWNPYITDCWDHSGGVFGTIQVGYLGHGQEPVLEWLHFVEFSQKFERTK